MKKLRAILKCEKVYLNILISLKYIFTIYKKKTCIKGQPGGTVVESAHSASAAWGSQVWIPGMDLHTTHQAQCGGIPFTKQKKSGTDVSSGTIFLTKKKRLVSIKHKFQR